MPFITQGKTNLKYILIVVILAVIVGGGILAYQYWLVPKEEAKVPEIGPIEKISKEEILKEYSNPFYSFQYPSSYEISSEMVNAEHKKGAGGRDIYGLTSIQMEGKVNGFVYSINISSTPNWNKWSFSKLLEEEKKAFEKFKEDDKIEVVVIKGKDAIRKFYSYFESETEVGGRFLLGRDIVIIPTENYGYVIEMIWTNPFANNPNHKARVEFENLLQSFIIKMQ